LGVVRNIVKTNLYRDSIQLLHVSEEAKRIDGVEDAAIVMGTSTNKDLLEKLGLLGEEGRRASEDDMIISIKVSSPTLATAILQSLEEIVLAPSVTEHAPVNLDEAFEECPDVNLAIVSLPGESVKEVTMKLLARGIHVHLFSDHVPPEQELELKTFARARGLLVMGPGAGTSIFGGKSIAFANVVKNGPIGIVAAAGTGLQEVSVLLSEADIGISQALGTGGGDVKSKIGGITMLQCIEALEQDPDTEAVLIVSKPPDDDVLDSVMKQIMNSTTKPYVTCFIGAKDYLLPTEIRKRIRQVKTLHAGVTEIMRVTDHYGKLARFGVSRDELWSLAIKVANELTREQKYIRGLYTGGTLAYETLAILHPLIPNVYSNAPLNPQFKLPATSHSIGDSIIDLGEEEFTRGRAHPMIDPTIRKIRLTDEAKNADVAVVMMDFILGYGSNDDPVGVMLPTIKDTLENARRNGRKLPIFAHVCGTENDPQKLSNQNKMLNDAGVETFQTNALMAFAAAVTSRRGMLDTDTVDKVWSWIIGS
jgi:succinyl-CoA synthetase alpha subunit